MRAVNALLTQLDALKRFPNAMVLTTSNITVRGAAGRGRVCVADTLCARARRVTCTLSVGSHSCGLEGKPHTLCG